MSTKSKTLKPKLPEIAPFDDELLKALEKIGPAELRALVFGYLSGQAAGNAALAKPGVSTEGLNRPSPEFSLADEVHTPAGLNLHAAAHAPPSFSIPARTLHATATAHPSFTIAARTEVFNPTVHIVNCILDTFRREGIAVSLDTHPVDVYPYQSGPGLWSDIAMAIYACIVIKCPKFRPYATRANALPFYNSTLGYFASKIAEVAV